MNSDSLLKGWTSLFFSVPQYWRHSEINCTCWVPGPSSQYLTDGSVCNSACYQETSPCVKKRCRQLFAFSQDPRKVYRGCKIV
jgi:hypothetical protein